MQDFAPERIAAKEAITRLRQQPVMAEDFGAQLVSSQRACLEGVRNSNIYIGICCDHYGYIAPAHSLAATEEEFQEARRRGMPILCFEKKGAKEPAQAEFLSRIKAYETGYSVALFDSPEELIMQVVQALHDVIGNPGITVLDAVHSVCIAFGLSGRGLDRTHAAVGRPAARPRRTSLGGRWPWRPISHRSL